MAKNQKHISKETYLKAQQSLQKLIEGVPVLNEDNEIIGWVEKPDVSAIKYAIDKYGIQEMDN